MEIPRKRAGTRIAQSFKKNRYGMDLSGPIGGTAVNPTSHTFIGTNPKSTGLRGPPRGNHGSAAPALHGRPDRPLLKCFVPRPADFDVEANGLPVRGNREGWPGAGTR